MKWSIFLATLLLPIFTMAQMGNPYKCFRVENNEVIFEKIYDAEDGYLQNLELQIKSLPSIDDYSKEGGVITFTIHDISPTESEVLQVKTEDKNYKELRYFNSFSFFCSVYLKDNRYKVMLTNIRASYVTDGMSSITDFLFNMRKSEFRKAGEKMGHPTERYLANLFALKDIYSKKDW